MRLLKTVLASSVVLASVTVAMAQGAGGGGAGGGGGGSGDPNLGVSPNGTADGPAGPYGTQTGGGRSVSNGGPNAVDVMRTQPPGAENQQR